MPIAATIGAVGSLGAAGIGAYSSLTASQQQAQQAQNALQFQQQVYNTNLGNIATQQSTNNSNLQPYIGTGQNALYSLASLYGLPTPGNPSGGAQGVNQAYQAFTNLPAYQFPFQQGSLALSDMLNAQGKQQSGAQARESQEFGQGLASQYLMSNYVNPLMSLAGQGQSASTNLSQINSNLTSGGVTASVNSGSQIGQTFGNLGTAQASGTIGAGNAISAGLTGGTSSLALYSALAGGGSAYGGGGTTGSNLANTIGYNNSTNNYLGMTNAQQDSLQDSGFNLP